MTLDLTHTTISGLDVIDTLNVGTTLTIDAASISNTALVLKAANTVTLEVTETTTGTNWTFGLGSLAEIDLATGVSFSVNESALSTTLTTILGDVGGENFNIVASGADAAIDMRFISTVTNLEAINVTDGAGNNTITTSPWDAVRLITHVSLGTGSDIVVLGNQGIATGAASATITGFLAGNVGAYDQISSQ